MIVKIKVTKDVLERSKECGIHKRYKGDSCGIAVAIIDLFPSAQIGNSAAFLLSDGPNMQDERSKVYLPISAIHFIYWFDQSNPEQRVLMQPFSFEIEVPEYVIEKIGIGEMYRVLSESKTLELVM